MTDWDAEIQEFLKMRQANGPFVLTREDLCRIVIAVEKYTREHIIGHITNDGTKACLFNAGSEREVMVEDEAWGLPLATIDEDAQALVVDALWNLGFTANHGEE